MKRPIRMFFILLTLFCCIVSATYAQPKVGSKAPDFTITLSNGTKTSLSSLKGKAVLVHFWATWCPPCVRELPGMDKLAKKLSSQKNPKLVFIGICVSDEEKNRADFMNKNKYTFPCGLDSDGSVAANKYAVSGIPTSVLVGPDGTVLDIKVGMMTEDELAKFVKKYAD